MNFWPRRRTKHIRDLAAQTLDLIEQARALLDVEPKEKEPS